VTYGHRTCYSFCTRFGINIRSRRLNDPPTGIIVRRLCFVLSPSVCVTESPFSHVDFAGFMGIVSFHWTSIICLLVPPYTIEPLTVPTLILLWLGVSQAFPLYVFRNCFLQFSFVFQLRLYRNLPGSYVRIVDTYPPSP